jgi:hypothetical protein
MAEKSPTTKPPTPPDIASMVPGLKYQNLAYLGVALALIWALVVASGSRAAMGVMAVLTAALIAGGVWVWRWIQKQQRLANLVTAAQGSPEERKKALAQLSTAEADKDVMNVIVRAQLEAQEDPDKALATLETVDIDKVPAMAQDDVRAMKAQMYLMNGRVKDAAELADKMKPVNAQQAEQRAMMVATMAEAWARSGREKDAADLLLTCSPDDAANEKVKVPLLFARIYTNHAQRKNDLARKDMLALSKENVNYLGRFMEKRFRPPQDLQKMAQEVAMRNPEVKKMAQQMARSQSQRGYRR